jgi:putative hydrolase of the HAD superfamily
MACDAVLFDLDGTLSDDDYAVHQALLRFQGAHPEFATTPFEQLRSEWQRLLRLHFPDYLSGKISMQEQRRRRMTDLFRGAGHSVDERTADEAFSVYAAAYDASWRAFDDVVPALDALRGFRLAVVTNGQQEQQMNKLRAIGVSGYFDDVFISSRTGVAKPAREAFLRPCTQLGVDPQRCVFVGDSLDIDARGATAAGLRGVWLRRPGAPVAEEGAYDGPIIRTLADLVGRVTIVR